MKRRGNHEGSIYQQPNGRWRAQLSLSGRRLSHTAATQRACRDWLKATVAQIDDGLTIAGNRATVAGFLASWLQGIQPTVRESTWRSYERVVRCAIVPQLGRLRLQDLRPDHVQALYSQRLEAGDCPASVRLVHAVLRRALGQALSWGLIRRNVCEAVQPPALRRSEMRTLSADQVAALLAAARDHRLRALLYLAVTTGLRKGELLGLQWTDLDWSTGRLQVQRQNQWVRGGGVQTFEPKSARGRRSIVLGPGALAVLREHRQRQLQERLLAGARWEEAGWMFPSTTGHPHDASYLVVSFKALLGRAGLPRIRFHDLRHTAATLMLEQGIHPKVVQERLGHSSVALTLDIYSHVAPTLEDDAALRIEAAIAGWPGVAP